MRFYCILGHFFQTKSNFSKCPVPHCNWVLGDCIKFGHFLPNSDLFRATFVADCIKFWSFCKILVFFGLFQKKPEFRAEARNSGLSGSTVFDCSWGTLLGKSIMHFWQREAHWELTGGQFWYWNDIKTFKDDHSIKDESFNLCRYVFDVSI